MDEYTQLEAKRKDLYRRECVIADRLEAYGYRGTQQEYDSDLIAHRDVLRQGFEIWLKMEALRPGSFDKYEIEKATNYLK